MTGAGQGQREADLVRSLTQRLDRLKSLRQPHETRWQAIADFIRPERSFTTPRTPGEDRSAGIFDSTAQVAAANLAAGMWGMLTNSASDWFALTHPDPALAAQEEVQLWYEDTNRRLRAAFAADGGPFYGQALEVFADLTSFGTAVHLTEDLGPPSGPALLHFRCVPLAEVWVSEGGQGRIDTVFRRFTWTARAAVARWGGAVSERLREVASSRPDDLQTFLHAVYPNQGRVPGRIGPVGMAFAATTVHLEDNWVLEEAGYHELPYQIPRWWTTSGNEYGDSPAMKALADVRMLNRMSKTVIVGAEKAVDPPLIAPDEDIIRQVRTRPGGIIYGGVSIDGRQLVYPLHSGMKVDIGFEMERQRREAIREAFFWSMLFMAPSPNMTATEVLARQQEKLRLLGPHLGKILSEFLDPLIDRVFAILWRRGQIAPLPDALAADPQIAVDYVSPLAQAQRAAEGQSLLQALSALAPMAQMRPEVMDNVDADEWSRKVLRAHGVSPSVLVDPRRRDQARAQRAQAAMQAQMQAAMPEMAGALKDTAVAAKAGAQAMEGA